ncbi:MAG TPA: TolC family protein [Polyangia bacterium]|nr:TolC family protein [Polyangia bacterium]
MVLRALIPLMLVASLAAAAELPPDPTLPARLTLKDALAIFRTHGLDLLIAEAAAETAAGDVLSANAVPNPNAAVGYYHFFFNDTKDANGNPLFDTHHGWFAGLGDSNAIEDSLSGKRGLRRGVAEAALAAARLQRADAERTLELQVKEQYFQAVTAAAALEFARETEAATARTFDLNQIRYKSGAISEVDLSRTETAKLEAEQAIDAAAQALHAAKVQLAFLLGRRQSFSDFQIESDQLRFVVPPALEGSSPQRLVDRAFEARPDLRAQENQRLRAGRAMSLAHRQRFPDLGLGVEYQQQGSPSAGNAVSPPTLQISLTGIIPLFYQQQGEIKKAEADARAQDAQDAKLRAQILAEVENAYTGWLTARQLVQRMEGRLLDRARRAQELVELQYQKGAASLLEYLDARRTYVSIKGEYIQDLAAYWNAIFQIEAATATELVQ